MTRCPWPLTTGHQTVMKRDVAYGRVGIVMDAAMFCLAGVGAASDNRDQPGSQGQPMDAATQTMMDTWQAYASPNDNHNMLNPLVGSWRDVAKWRRKPDGSPEMKCTVRIRLGKNSVCRRSSRPVKIETWPVVSHEPPVTAHWSGKADKRPRAVTRHHGPHPRSRSRRPALRCTGRQNKTEWPSLPRS